MKVYHMTRLLDVLLIEYNVNSALYKYVLLLQNNSAIK